MAFVTKMLPLFGVEKYVGFRIIYDLENHEFEQNLLTNHIINYNMVKIEANGGDGYNGGVGGKGGYVSVTAGSINDLSALVNVIENNPTIINQKFEEISKQVDANTTLKNEQKSKIKNTLEAIKNAIVTAEPYARPLISQLFMELSTIH